MSRDLRAQVFGSGSQNEPFVKFETAPGGFLIGVDESERLVRDGTMDSGRCH